MGKHDVLKTKSGIFTLIVGLLLAILVAGVTYTSIEMANYNKERSMPAIAVAPHDDSGNLVLDSDTASKAQELNEQRTAVQRRNTVIRVIVSILVFAVVMFFAVMVASVSDKKSGKLLTGVFVILCLLIAGIIFLVGPNPIH